MMCQRIGMPPSSTMGLGRYWDSSVMREPRPPASSTTFIAHLSDYVSDASCTPLTYYFALY